MAGLIIIGFLVLVAIFAPLLAPYDPEVGLLGEEGEERRSAPCIHMFGCPEDQPQHIMGLDSNARDVFSRIVYGSRVSLTIGFTTVTAAVLVGAVLGAIAGFWGGLARQLGDAGYGRGARVSRRCFSPSPSLRCSGPV